MKSFDTNNMFANDAVSIKFGAYPEEKALYSEQPDTVTVDALHTVTDSENNVVGFIGEKFFEDFHMHGIEFFTLPEYRRKGYAAAAIRGFTRTYYENCATANMLIAVIQLENVPAIRAVERAGYDYVRTMGYQPDENTPKSMYHMYVCSRETAEAGAPPKGCCCGCGGHADGE